MNFGYTNILFIRVKVSYNSCNSRISIDVSVCLVTVAIGKKTSAIDNRFILTTLYCVLALYLRNEIFRCKQGRCFIIILNYNVVISTSFDFDFIIIIIEFIIY